MLVLYQNKLIKYKAILTRLDGSFLLVLSYVELNYCS